MTSGLHPDLVGPWEGCQAVRRELLGALDDDARARWRAPAAVGGWTLAQQVDHLLRAEIGTSKLTRKLIRGDFAGLARPRGAALHTSALAAYPYGRLPAPEGLEPADLAFDEARERLAAAHGRFLEELRRFPGPDADALAAPDPATGVWFTLAGWVRLQELHEAHHLGQIRGARARGRPGRSLNGSSFKP